jgi:hypothetical protein
MNCLDDLSPMEMLSRAVLLHCPEVLPKKTPWRVREEAKSALKAVRTTGGMVNKVLVYLDTAHPDHDGGSTYRPARYVVKDDCFFCATTNRELLNVHGWLLLGEELDK